MPKATMYLNNGTVLRKNHIRLSWQRFHMQPVPEASGMQQMTQSHFGLSILTADRLHITRAGTWRMNISHNQAASSDLSSVVDSIFSLASMIRGFIIFATAANTGTTTELPNCL